MKDKKLINDFTNGSVVHHLVRFMLPFMASNALQVIYSLVDMVIVGHFVGKAGLSAVSQGGMIIIFGTMLSLGFCNSGQVVISQLVGANKRGELQKVIGSLFTIILLYSLVAMALTAGLSRTWVDLIGVPDGADDFANQYVIVCGIGLIFSCGYNAVAAILRGMGDSKHPFVFITITSVLNLILDIVLTGLLDMKVWGAAFATAFSQGVSLIVSLIFLYRRKDAFHFDFRLQSFRIDKVYTAKMLKLGIPLALQTCTINISMIICNAFINSVGLAASATFGVGMKIDDIAHKLALGVQYAAAPMVGQNIAAGKPKRVRSIVFYTWLMSGIVYAIFFSFFITMGPQIFGLFTSDPEVIELAPVFISAIVWCFPAMVIMRGTSSFLQGTGNGRLILVLSCVDSCLRIVLSYLVGITMGMGFFGYAFGFGAAAYGVAIPATLYFFFSKWAEKKTLVSDK